MHRWGLLVAYLGFMAAGVVLLMSPSPSLRVHGGVVLVVVCALQCILGSLIGFYGSFFRKPVYELVAFALGFSASCTFAVALVIQAIQTKSAAPLTAASFMLVVIGLTAQQWTDAVNRKE